MTAEEQARMENLAQRIQEEKDHGKFMELVDDLNELLGSIERRSPSSRPREQSPHAA